MKNLEQLKKYLETADAIESGITKYKETIKESNCDKHRIGFTKGDMYSAAEINISIDSMLVCNGSSDCSRVITLNHKEIFKEEFVRVLNSHFDTIMFETIMFETASRLKEKANSLKEATEKELSETLKMVKELC